MVRLQEVPDEHFSEEQQGAKIDDEDDDAYYTDSDSEISDDDENEEIAETLEESFADRLSALKDMIPPKHRAAITNTFNTGYSWVSSSLFMGGKTLWVLSTSAIMLGVPYALAVSEEQQMIEMEKEMKMQQITTESLTPGAQTVHSQQQQQLP